MGDVRSVPRSGVPRVSTFPCYTGTTGCRPRSVGRPLDTPTSGPGPRCPHFNFRPVSRDRLRGCRLLSCFRVPISDSGVTSGLDLSSSPERVTSGLLCFMTPTSSVWSLRVPVVQLGIFDLHFLVHDMRRQTHFKCLSVALRSHYLQQ